MRHPQLGETLERARDPPGGGPSEPYSPWALILASQNQNKQAWMLPSVLAQRGVRAELYEPAPLKSPRDRV